MFGWASPLLGRCRREFDPADVLCPISRHDQRSDYVVAGLDDDGLSERVVTPDRPDGGRHKRCRVRLLYQGLPDLVDGAVPIFVCGHAVAEEEQAAATVGVEEGPGTGDGVETFGLGHARIIDARCRAVSVGEPPVKLLKTQN